MRLSALESEVSMYYVSYRDDYGRIRTDYFDSLLAAMRYARLYHDWCISAYFRGWHTVPVGTRLCRKARDVTELYYHNKRVA